MDQVKRYSIDLKSPVPAYQQIANSLISRIGNEEWLPSEKLPSENDLANEYEVSRITLRQALNILKNDNIIDKKQGKGVFVLRNPKVNVQELQFPSINNNGRSLQKSKVSSTNIEIEVIHNANSIICSKLQISENSPVVFLKRLFEHSGNIIGINRAWFPENKVKSLAKKGLINSSISTTLSRRYKIEVEKIENYIEAIKLDSSTAYLLNSVYDASALMINSVYFDSTGVPIEYSSTIWVGDYTRFHLLVTKETQKETIVRE